MTSTRWSGQHKQGHGPGLPPTAVLACSVGLRPQQRACPARPLQLASVHLHPVQKGRKGDPGSEGPSERQRAGERISGGRERDEKMHRLPGPAGWKRWPGLWEETQGKALATTTAATLPVLTDPQSGGRGKPFSYWNEGGRATNTKPALALWLKPSRLQISCSSSYKSSSFGSGPGLESKSSHLLTEQVAFLLWASVSPPLK